MTVTYNFIMLFILHLIPTTHQQLFYYMQKMHMINARWVTCSLVDR